MKGLWIVAVALTLLGCGKHYWGKPGAILADFSSDHYDCVAKVAMPGHDKAYGLVPQKLYRACLKAHGWERKQHVEPVPAGWFRGIEDEDVVNLQLLPPQPGRAPTAVAPLPPCERGAMLANARDSEGRWRCRPQ